MWAVTRTAIRAGIVMEYWKKTEKRNKKMKKMQNDVTIKEVDYGYIVTVGCKTLAFTTWQELNKELQAYAKSKTTELHKVLEKDAPQGITILSPSSNVADISTMNPLPYGTA